jgi:probable HAF family extracellular repeat protein
LPRRGKRIKEEFVRKIIVTLIASLSLCAGLALPLVLFAQDDRDRDNHWHHHYKLIDIGTLGGPNSNLSGPNVQTLNNQGTFAAIANTSAPNPNPGGFIPFNAPDSFVEHAVVWHNGTLTDLGVLPGGANSQTDWIDASGLIAAWSENGLIDPLMGVPEGVAVLWAGGKPINLGTLPGGTESLATSVNSRGQVVGFSSNDTLDAFSMVGLATQTRAFLWQNGVMTDLGTLGGPDALAGYVNERGQIAGQSYTSSSFSNNCNFPLTTAPFLWQNGKMIDLGTLGGTCGYTNWLNQRGQVVGNSNLAGDATHHGFLWDNGTLTDLGTLGGNGSEADSISDSGFIVGRADVPGSLSHHAFRWKNGVMADLGIIPGQPCSTALSVNSIGQVVGETGICGVGGGPAFLSDNGEPMVDVNTLVVPASEIEVISEFDINDLGEIAGQGLLPNGDVHAVLLIPCDENHAGVEGCDYSLVDAGTAAEVQPRPINQAPANLARLSPERNRTRFRSLKLRQSIRFGAPQVPQQ